MKYSSRILKREILSKEYLKYSTVGSNPEVCHTQVNTTLLRMKKTSNSLLTSSLNDSIKPEDGSIPF
jgi:hypothetical protein